MEAPPRSTRRAERRRAGRARRALARACTLAAIAALCVWVVVGGTAGAASTASSTVAVTVASSSWIDAAGCATGASGITDFGTVLPATSNVTTSDCAVLFGSSNDTSMLRIYQGDGTGASMTLPTRGVLDSGFDGDGHAAWPVLAAHDDMYAAVPLAGGDALLAGTCSSDFCAIRVNPDGTLDASFDGDGKASWPVLAGADSLTDAVILTSGDVLLTGSCHNGANYDFCAIRVNPDGTLDTAFDGDGKASWPVLAANDTAWSAALLGDGDVVITGYCVAATVDFCGVRANPDGTLDSAFDGDGKASWAVLAAADTARTTLVTGSGSILVAGYCDTGTQLEMCAIQVLPNGALDASFDGDGKGTWSFGAMTSTVEEALLHSSGDLFLTGYCNGQVFCAIRLNTDGSLDAAFDGDGKQTWSMFGGFDTATTAVELADGDLLIAGQCPPSRCALRVNATGAIDTAFDGDGKGIWASGAGDDVRDVVVQADGYVLLGGTCWYANRDFCAVRLSPGATVAGYVDDGSADWDTAGSLNLFGACLRDATTGALGGAGAWVEGPGNACPATDGTYWNAIPAAAPGAKVAYATAPDPQGGGSDPTANLRFGFRARTDQAAGTYTALVVFEVVAPNA